MSAEQKPTAEALIVAAKIVHSWYSKALEDKEIVQTLVSANQQIILKSAIAALITAKDATIARYQKAVDTQLGEIRALEKAVREKDAEIERLKDDLRGLQEHHDITEQVEETAEEQNQQQRALLEKLATALKPFADYSGAFSEDYRDDDRIAGAYSTKNGAVEIITMGQCRNAARLLSTPAVVELLKEVRK